jgi:hypothetical protein
MTRADTKRRTHRDLLPKDMCPSLMMKHIATHSLDDEVFDDRKVAGDGYYWCLRTCRDVGPDDELVKPHACVPGRLCYRGPQT